jgi:hypothetical protein
MGHAPIAVTARLYDELDAVDSTLDTRAGTVRPDGRTSEPDIGRMTFHE